MHSFSGIKSTVVETQRADHAKEIVTGLSLSELQSFDGFIAVCPSSCEVFPRFALPLILTCISEHLGTALLALSAGAFFQSVLDSRLSRRDRKSRHASCAGGRGRAVPGDPERAAGHPGQWRAGWAGGCPPASGPYSCRCDMIVQALHKLQHYSAPLRLCAGRVTASIDPSSAMPPCQPTCTLLDCA